MEETKKFAPGTKVVANTTTGSIVKDCTYYVLAQHGEFVELKDLFTRYHVCCFDKAETRETIVITTNGDRATAQYIKEGKVVRERNLKRDRADRHDLKKLAAFAVQKLFPKDGNNILVVKAGYTGSVVVVNSRHPAFKDGRILEFYGGRCTASPTPSLMTASFDCLEDVRRYAQSYVHPFDVIELHRN